MDFLRLKATRTGDPLLLSTVDIVSVTPLIQGSRVTMRGGAIHDVQEAFDAVTKVLMPSSPAPGFAATAAPADDADPPKKVK